MPMATTSSTCSPWTSGSFRRSRRRPTQRALRRARPRSKGNGVIDGTVRRGAAACLVVAAALALSGALEAHGVSRRDALFVQSIDGPAVVPFLYLGAKHMVTGYDHLMFLVGVIFFLYRLKDVVQYVSLFTIGHSVTLLAGVLGGIHANAYIIDAIIGGFDRLLGFRPNTRAAVMVFVLFHGFGLATKLQEFTVSPNGLITNIVSLNVGAEIGQVLALTAVLLGISYWRRHRSFLRHSFAANTVLMAGGFVLVGYQLTGYLRG